MILSTLFFGLSLAQGEAISVPMKMRGQMPGLEVMVNGKGPYHFGLDTGGQGQARADTSLVEELGLQKVGETRAMGGSGQTIMMPIVSFDEVKIGTVIFSDVRAPSRDYNTGTPLPPVSGIIGFNLFKDHLLTLDYPGKKITIGKGSVPEPDGKSILSAAGSSGIPAIEVSVAGNKAICHVDSGNLLPGVILPEAVFDKCKFTGEVRELGQARGAAGTIEIVGATLDGNLEIGEFTIINPMLIKLKGVDRPTGNIGSLVLKHFATTYDQKNKRMRFERDGSKAFKLG